MKLCNTALIIAALVICGGFKTAQANTIQIGPATQNASLGENVIAAVLASGFGDGAEPSIGAYDLNIAFDSGILSFISASFSNGLDVLGLGSIQTVTPGSGTVELFELSLDSTVDLNALQPDTFSLAELNFQAIGSGTSPLSLSANAISDANGNTLPTTLASGSVQVGETESTSTPEANSLWLSAAGLAMLTGAAMRRTAISGKRVRAQSSGLYANSRT